MIDPVVVQAASQSLSPWKSGFNPKPVHADLRVAERSKRESEDALLLGLRIRKTPEAWMFVLYGKRKRYKPENSRQRNNTGKVRRDNKRRTLKKVCDISRG
jgi:hypothetical protein